ncbi:hydantoinase/oxoprolinase family protein [Acerihabitans sp. TG2]|uniref:hydantoinase/oxoprolinase family protein n=1 Tax=Acerihabitans sp. TG2 TaxID=3096008 RepID=UPI002B23D540|nr:hydantoinase/oxoprolinase family protein [Acerihabitans sp. TG2]MEA9389589.1 hydantoinase/oxoprolinase family protein [Acerihabitans sp. TG2]
MFKMGIDVGGTNTDAVLLDDKNQVVFALKTPTTADVESGILTALDQMMKSGAASAEKIGAIMLGTTHATNAIIERRHLSKIACVRICLPAGTAIEPLFTWPDDLKAATGQDYYYVHGGCESNGKPLAGETLDRAECMAVLDAIKLSGAESIAVTAIFSSVQNSYENEFAELAADVLGRAFPVTMSYQIGSLGILARENSTALNAALIGVARTIVNGLALALAHHDIDADIYFAQNDGTLMDINCAQRYPILTIGSGPTNSIRGAAQLSGLQECIICDIGGTTTDIGILVQGFPRESSVAVTIGGVKTNFRMPDIISIGIGGGSIVRETDHGVTVGPDSVGYEITSRSYAFGGNVLTATDCLLASGLAHIDHPDCDARRLRKVAKKVWQSAIENITNQVTDAIDQIKTSPKDIPVVLVGGGIILIPGDIQGASEVIRPKHSGCANAVGAAMADISGGVDRLFSMAGRAREEVLAQAGEQAKYQAIASGAEPESVELVELEELPLAYATGDVVRIKAKAVGRRKDRRHG